MAIKSIEAVSGCFAGAADDEPLFVLRAQDLLAAAIVREWAEQAHHTGRVSRQKINEALALADQMEAWPNRKYPD